MTKGIWFHCAAALALTACSSATSPNSSPAPADTSVAIAQSNVVRVAAEAVPTADVQAVAAANNAFAVDLYGQVRQAAPSGNLLTSPISASLALTMSYAGALGQTQTEMAKVLHLPDGDRAFAGQNALSQALLAHAAQALSSATSRAKQAQQPAPAAEDYQLQLINTVWGQTGYSWEGPFLDVLAANYGTGVHELDFAHAYEPARLTINGYVSEQTGNKINDFLPVNSLDADTRMVLINALHLKLPWLTAFSPEATQPGTFTRGDTSTVQNSFMRSVDGFPYIDDGRAQVAAVPLFGGDLWLVVALPHEGSALADYEATLSASAAPLHVPGTSALLDLSLPKAAFTSQTFSLARALSALGMEQAFDKNLANFRGLCANPADGHHLYVADVLQKTMIAMQETGVEAAAATAVIMGAGLAIAPSDPEPAPVPIEMNVNRPYLVSIVDQSTDTVLMLGHIQDPTDAGEP